MLNPTCPGRYDPFETAQEATARGAVNPYDCHVVIPPRAQPNLNDPGLGNADFFGWFGARQVGSECVLQLEVNTCNEQSIAANGGTTTGLACQERGDMRYKFLSFVDQPGTPFLGIATLRGDPVTGELHLFGYGFLPPYLTYYVVDKTGAVVTEQVIELPNPVMMHDFQLTKTRAVFLDLPVVFDWTAARAGDRFPFRWKPEAGARIGLLPRGGKGTDIKWLPLPPCFIFHTLNAYDDGDQVVLEACRFDSLWEKGVNDTSQPPYLTRFTLDEKRGTVTESRIHPHLTDFPVLDPRRIAQKHRYGYSLLLDAGTAYGPAWMKGLAKLDTQGDRVTVYEAPSGHRLDEMTFVPKSETAGEDEGFLVGFVYDHSTDRSALWVFDAQDIQKGPIAKAHLPYRVPFGFHGTFLPKLG